MSQSYVGIPMYDMPSQRLRFATFSVNIPSEMSEADAQAETTRLYDP
jgi:hypothetical protein